MKIFNILFPILLISTFFGCTLSNKEEVKENVIIVSKRYNDQRFYKWIKHFSPSTVVKGMYHLPKDSINYYLTHSNGMIISGGADVHPALYGQGVEIERCGKPDTKRDSIEMRMINYALSHKTPILGICRGEQIMNVAKNGSLIIDIPTDFDTSVVHRIKKGYVEHPVNLNKSSYLYAICKTETGNVKSKHHQGVDKIASVFSIGATTSDGLIEAIEITDTLAHPFAIGVQWHPEIMDYGDPLSEPIIKLFLKKSSLNIDG